MGNTFSASIHECIGNGGYTFFYIPDPKKVSRTQNLMADALALYVWNDGRGRRGIESLPRRICKVMRNRGVMHRHTSRSNNDYNNLYKTGLQATLLGISHSVGDTKSAQMCIVRYYHTCFVVYVPYNGPARVLWYGKHSVLYACFHIVWKSPHANKIGYFRSGLVYGLLNRAVGDIANKFTASVRLHLDAYGATPSNDDIVTIVREQRLLEIINAINVPNQSVGGSEQKCGEQKCGEQKRGEQKRGEQKRGEQTHRYHAEQTDRHEQYKRNFYATVRQMSSKKKDPDIKNSIDMVLGEYQENEEYEGHFCWDSKKAGKVDELYKYTRYMFPDIYLDRHKAVVDLYYQSCLYYYDKTGQRVKMSTDVSNHKSALLNNLVDLVGVLTRLAKMDMYYLNIKSQNDKYIALLRADQKEWETRNIDKKQLGISTEEFEKSRTLLMNKRNVDIAQAESEFQLVDDRVKIIDEMFTKIWGVAQIYVNLIDRNVSAVS